MIRTYTPTEKTFPANGDVVINPLRARIYNQDNGDYYLELDASLDYIDYLVKDNIIIANTPTSEQPFRVESVQKTRSKVTVKAYHVTFDSKNYLIADSYVVDKTCAQALSHLNAATEPQSIFTTGSDILTIDSYRCVRNSLHEAVTTVQERWGGHIVRDNFDISIRNDIGQDRGVIVEYRKNLKSITVDEDWTDVITKILPVGTDGILLNEINPNASIYITSSTQYDLPYTKTVSFSQDFDQEDYPTERAYKTALVNDLRAQATKYLEDNCTPKINYTLSAHLDGVTDLGDTIHVKDDRLKLNMLTNVISYEYDCVLKRFTEIEFGNFKPKLSGLIPAIQKSVRSTLDYEVSGIEDQIYTVNADKQDALVSGVNLKTVNGVSLLGSGDVSAGGSVLDFYPVGSYYETSDATFDPNVAWGGTWVLEASGKVHVSAGTGYQIGDTGGAETVNLSDAEIAHGHGFTAPTVSGGGVTSGITGGSHHHTIYRAQVAANGSGRLIPDASSSANGVNTTDTTHTHDLPDHSHAVSGGSVADLSGPSNTRTAHNNMQPYVVVNRWHRTA